MSTTCCPTLEQINTLVELALKEDIGSGDITAALISNSQKASAKVVAREPGILCGIPWATAVCAQVDASIELHWLKEEGASLEKDEIVLRLDGPARALLTAERSILNFLQTLSGVATATRAAVDSVASTPVKILDTRKTIPGLRTAQKYAVTVGGGVNHRMGLFDAYLIKENHIAACGGISKTIATARLQAPGKPVEIEVQNLSQLSEAIAAEADIVMLDNFSLAETVEAVTLNAKQVKLEASGNITSQTLREIAGTGVDFISIGALTKHCRALDLSMLFD